MREREIVSGYAGQWVRMAFDLRSVWIEASRFDCVSLSHSLCLSPIDGRRGREGGRENKAGMRDQEVKWSVHLRPPRPPVLPSLRPTAARPSFSLVGQRKPHSRGRCHRCVSACARACVGSEQRACVCTVCVAASLSDRLLGGLPVLRLCPRPSRPRSLSLAFLAVVFS